MQQRAWPSARQQEKGADQAEEAGDRGKVETTLLRMAPIQDNLKGTWGKTRWADRQRGRFNAGRARPARSAGGPARPNWSSASQSEFQKVYCSDQLGLILPKASQDNRGVNGQPDESDKNFS